MNLSGLLSKMLMLFLFLCIGILCTKIKIIDEQGSKVINKLVLNIFAPAMMINSVLNTELSYSIGEVLMLLADAMCFNVIALVIGWLFARFFCRKREVRGTFQLVSAFGNVAFMGYPVISALYGNSAIFLASVCTIPFNLFLYSVGTMLAAGGKTKDLPWKKVFLSPVLIATVIAMLFFFFEVSLPVPLTEAFGYLSNMVIPLSMILIGSSLGRMKAKSVLLCGRYYAVCFCKLIILPLAVFCVFRLLIKDELILGMLVVISSMPTAAMTPVLCTEYGGDSDFANSCVFLSTLLSLATVPLMIWLLLL